MKALVVYDSVFGNTARVAEAVGAGLSGQEVTVARAGEVKTEQLAGLDLLVAGSPTRKFRATEAMQAFIKGLEQGRLAGVRVAAFDTRIQVDEKQPWILRVFVKIFGYAAGPMLKGLQKAGGTPATAPVGFIVNGTEGPLKEGELERAARWARTLMP